MYLVSKVILYRTALRLRAEQANQAKQIMSGFDKDTLLKHTKFYRLPQKYVIF